jgi:hypothetical protein
MAYNDGYKGPNGPYQTGRGPLTALVRLICAWHLRKRAIVLDS